MILDVFQFDELLNDISDGKIDATLLLSMLNEDARSNYYVTFLRSFLFLFL